MDRLIIAESLLPETCREPGRSIAGPFEFLSAGPAGRSMVVW